MDETLANGIQLCEKYPNHKAKVAKKGKPVFEDVDKEEAFRLFGLAKEE